MSIKKNIIVVYSSQVLTIAISFVSSIFLSRILGPEGRGEQALFSNSMAFSGLFFGFSINSTITYFLNSGKIKIEKLFFSLLLFYILTSLLLFGSLLYLKYLNLLELALPTRYQQMMYILIFVMAYFFTLYASILNSFLTANKIFRKQNLLILIPNALMLLIYIMIYSNVIKGTHVNDFNLAVFGFLFTSLANLVIMYCVFRKELQIDYLFSFLSRDEIVLFIRYSFLAYMGNIAQFLSYRMDIWTVDQFCGKYNLGIYSQAIMLLQMLWVLPNTLGSILYSYASQASFEAIREKALQLIRLSMYSTLAISIVFLIFSYFFVPVLFGPKFGGSVEIIFILVTGYVAFSIPSTSSSLFAAYGHFKVNFYISFIVAFVSVFLYYYFTKYSGLYGAAIASDLSYLLTTVACFFVLKKYFDIRPGDLFNIKGDVSQLKLIISKYVKI